MYEVLSEWCADRIFSFGHFPEAGALFLTLISPLAIITMVYIGARKSSVPVITAVKGKSAESISAWAYIEQV